MKQSYHSSGLHWSIHLSYDLTKGGINPWKFSNVTNYSLSAS
jgi:hypothetical protein